jgi:hypothetical protein
MANPSKSCLAAAAAYLAQVDDVEKLSKALHAALQLHEPPADDDEAAAAAAKARRLFESAALASASADELEKACVDAGSSEAVARACASTWKLQLAAKGRQLLLESGAELERLVDVQWTLGVAASSSECASLGATWVQMRLVVRRASGALESVHMEISVPAFYDLLAELERARASLQLLS